MKYTLTDRAMETSTFTYVECKILVGIDESNHDLFGICVNYNTNNCKAFTPNIGFPHTVIRTFTASVPKKSMFGILVTSLRDIDIVPVSGFNHPINPDNQYYIELPASKLDTAIDNIRLRINGVAKISNNNPAVSEQIMLADEKKNWDGNALICTTLVKKKPPSVQVWH